MDVPAVATEADFDQMSWHDARVWGIELRVGDDDDAFLADLALNLDLVTNWACGVDGIGELETAPATLVFHGVTDPRLEIEWEYSGYQVALHELSIGTIERIQQPGDEQLVFPGRPYYLWRIAINWPEEGEITFGAVGFTQTLHADPVPRRHDPLSRRRGGVAQQPALLTEPLPSQHEARAVVDAAGEMVAGEVTKAAMATPSRVKPGELLGTWEACDPATGGLVKVIIAAGAGGLTVRAFGRCHPSPCDWGTVPARAYATAVDSRAAVAFTARYALSPADELLVGVLDRGVLVIETFAQFTDGSDRSDYSTKGYFSKRTWR